ncbi:MAG: hypothetical protein AB9903_24380 [Vulcanimicrobiota bacterium]
MKSKDFIYGDEAGYARSVFLRRGPVNVKDSAEKLKVIVNGDFWRNVPLDDMRFLASQLHRRISNLCGSCGDEQKWDEIEGFIVSCTDKAEEILEDYRRRIACNGDVQVDAELMSSFLEYRDSLHEIGELFRELRRGSQAACRDRESILSPFERIAQFDQCVQKIKVQVRSWADFVMTERKTDKALSKTQALADSYADFPGAHIHKG